MMNAINREQVWSRLMSILQSLAGLFGPGAFGRELGKPPPVNGGLVAAVELVERASQVIVHVGIGFVRAQSAGKSAERQIGFALLQQEAAEIGPRFDVIFIQFQGYKVSLPRTG